LLTRHSGKIFIAEITMLEILSALASELHGARIQKADFEAANKAFLGDVAEGRVRVRPFGMQEYLASRALLHHVAVHLGRHLRTQDAIVACSARELALETRSTIPFYTCDQRLAKTLSTIDAFKLLDVRHYQP
jgi:hypothetical protein